MASCATASADIFSYESHRSDFTLTLAQKQECLEALHCPYHVHSTCPQGQFITWTSHWVKKRKLSSAVYKLFKIKRWHLIYENFLFDPLKRNKQFKRLTPSTTLWRDLNGVKDVEEYLYSIDGIIAKYLEKEAFDSLKILDSMLESLDDYQEAKTDMQAENVFEELECNYVETASFPYKAYSAFLRSMGNAVVQCITHEKVGERCFESAIRNFINLITGVLHNDMTWCDRDVHGVKLDKITIPVKLSEQDSSLLISSHPDLFLWCTPNGGILEPSVILGVIEVKGRINNTDVLHSSDDDEDDDPPACSGPTLSQQKHSARRKKCKYACNIQHKQNNLHSIKEVDEEEDEDDVIEELSLEQSVEDTREWLTGVTSLPPFALKDLRQFLPQLLGEMLCVSRSEVVRSFETTSGMQFGIGVVGFDVYFVTMTDPSHKLRNSLINDDLAYLNVFVTRPFNILVREDRRTIIKILAASFHLDKLGV